MPKALTPLVLLFLLFGCRSASAPAGGVAPLPPSATAPPAERSLPPGHPRLPSEGVGDTGRLERAPGPEGRSVAEVFAQREALKDRVVEVRGRVVKVNAGIMKRNWLHLQDGSGSGEGADLTVTSQELAEVGEVVRVRGRVRVNQDMGAGYTYPVLVEGAAITKDKEPRGR